MVKVYYMSIKSWISVVGVVVAAEVTGKRIDGRKSRGDESAQERRPLHIVDHHLHRRQRRVQFTKLSFPSLSITNSHGNCLLRILQRFFVCHRSPTTSLWQRLAGY